MSDDLDAVIREMFPGIHPGTAWVEHQRRALLAATRLQRLQAVPDKEQSMKEWLADCTFPLSSSQEPQIKMPLSDALATLAALVDGDGRINADVHGLPIQFFGRDDVENVDVLVSQGRVLITGQLVIGGHRFLCFSEGFPMGAE